MEDVMHRSTYEPPSLKRFGSIQAITGTWGKCKDILPGNDKGLGGPIDLDWRFLFIACDLPPGESYASGV